MTKVLGVTRARILGQQVHRVGCNEPRDSDDAGYEEQLPVFHGRKKAQETRAEVRSADAFWVSSDGQKWKDRCNPDHLKQGLRKRERKNQTQLRSAVWPREKENATNQVGNVMNKSGHVSELHVQREWLHHIPQWRVGANYLRVKLRCQRLPETVDNGPPTTDHSSLITFLSALTAASSYSFLILSAPSPLYQPLKSRMSPRRTAVSKAS